MASESLNDLVVPSNVPLHRAVTQALTLLSNFQGKPMCKVFLQGRDIPAAAEKLAALLGSDIRIHAVPRPGVPASYDAVAEVLIFSPTSNRYFHFSPNGDGTSIHIFRADTLGKWLNATADGLTERLDSAMESIETCPACGLAGPYHHFLCKEVAQS